MSKVSNMLATTGNFCTITFVTKDGTIRTINGRTGVRKYIKGTGKRTASTDAKYLLLWCRDGSPAFNAPRNVNRNAIISVKAHGIKAEKNHNSVYADFV